MPRLLTARFVETVKPDHLRGLWRGEIEHLIKPFSDAFLNAKDGDYNAELLAHDFDPGVVVLVFNVVGRSIR